MSILGVDIGTTGTKAIVFNVFGEVLASCYIEYNTIFIKDGWIELDPKVVIDSTVNTIKKVSKQVSKSDPVKIIGISCLGCVVIPMDSKNNYLYNGMTFMDSRSVDDINKKIGMDEYSLYQITGIPMNPFFTLNKVLWLKENKKELFNNIKKFFTFKELLLKRLGIEPKTDHSLASSTMMYDLNRGTWSKEIFKNIDINPDLFPEIVNSWEIIGEVNDKYAGELNLNKNVKVIAGGVDTGSCPLGVGVYKPGLLSNTIGTFEEVVMLSEKLILNKNMLKKGILFSRNIVPNTYFIQGFPTTGGYVLKWFKNQFCKYEEELAVERKVDSYDIMLKDLSGIKTKVLFLPHLSGSGTPNIDENSRGAFLKISAGSQKEEFIKSIIEGLNFEIKLAIDFFEEKICFVENIHVTGGATKSDEWMQIKADVFNKDVLSPNINEAGCLGVSILAAYSIGIYKSIDEAVKNMFKIKKIYRSNKENLKYYTKKYDIYKKLYGILKSINK